MENDSLTPNDDVPHPMAIERSEKIDDIRRIKLRAYFERIRHEARTSGISSTRYARRRRTRAAAINSSRVMERYCCKSHFLASSKLFALFKIRSIMFGPHRHPTSPQSHRRLHSISWDNDRMKIRLHQSKTPIGEASAGGVKELAAEPLCLVLCPWCLVILGLSAEGI
jgi:hypothetical protein